MTTEQSTALQAFVEDCLNTRFYLRRDGGEWRGEIYADYRDCMEDSQAEAILNAKDIEGAFNEHLLDAYGDAEWYEKSYITKEVKSAFRKSELFNDATVEDLCDEAEEWIEDYVRDNVWFDYPDDHYRKQEFKVNILMDCGDGNYDFTLNSLYPCYCGQKGEAYPDEASLVWLARQQGYGKRALRKALAQGDTTDPEGFLDSCRSELVNLPSHMSTITFLVKMTFEQLMNIRAAIDWCERNGDRYHPRKSPDAGYIVLDKKTMCGLYDAWDGGGSTLEIQLEKDVRLPIKYIWMAVPDKAKCGGYHWPLGEVYGMCESAWRDTLKESHIPGKVWEC